MLTPPDGLPEDRLVSVLASGWGVAVVSLAYRAVGFGSHHWEALDAAGTRWFVTADELHARRAAADDFAVPYRDELEAALASSGAAGRGPYARPTALLLAASEVPIRRLLARYDELVVGARHELSRAVLTHGEPHPGNTMLASGRWLLIDWDTVLVAPPERDLWSLDPGDGSILTAYADATGVTPRPSTLELYRVRWDLADIAIGVSGFRRHHQGSADDDKSWDVLRSLIARIGG